MSTECYPLSCTPFASISNPNCNVFDRNNFAGEQLIFDSAYSDLIRNFGVNVNYYVHGYTKEIANNFYGEHTLQSFAPPVSIRMYVEISDNAITLQKFGFVSDDEFTGYLHIDTFTTIFQPLSYHEPIGQRIEPKSGDVVEMTDFGYCRPGNRGPRLYEITERVDQDFTTINQMYGSYVYKLKAKRYEHTFERGLSGERGNTQVYEGALTGTESLTGNRPYPEDVDVTSQRDVFDMNQNNTAPYGTYY